MFAGHFAIAAAVKSKNPQVPLWALMLGTQLLDVAFVPLFVAGIETMEAVGGGGYGGNIIHADYTHSLAGTLLLTLIAGLLSARFWGKRAGAVIAAVVFSHWLLDLLVHRADLPLLPGNAGELPLLGLGLWQTPVASIIVESLLIAVGGFLYFRSILSGTSGLQRTRALTASGVMGLLLVVALVNDVL